MMDPIIKLMVELFLVLALATEQIKQGGPVSAPSDMRMDMRYLCSMCHREIREEVVGEKERQDTGCPREIGSVDEGRRTVGCCTDLGCRPPSIKRNEQDVTFVISLPFSPFRCRDRRYSVGDQLQKDIQHWLSPPGPSTS